MVKEAEKYAQEDQRKKEEIELINQANGLVYATEKSVKDYGDKVSASDKSNIEKELNTLKEAIKSKDQNKIKSGMESLQKASHKLAEEIYKATAPKQESHAEHSTAEHAAGAGGESKGKSSSGGSGGQEDVIDADFKAEDEK